MGRVFESIMPEHESFMKRQPLFFVGTAAATGHVNLSPKGYDTFRILSTNRVAYLDLTGSGNETSAHLNENNRITFMFVSFGEKPLILRLYGTASVYLPGSAEWEELAPLFDLVTGSRQIIVADIHSVKTSCGFSMPLLSYEGERNQLIKWAENKGATGLETYWKEKNAVSMDGITTPLGKRIGEEA